MSRDSIENYTGHAAFNNFFGDSAEIACKKFKVMLKLTSRIASWDILKIKNRLKIDTVMTFLRRGLLSQNAGNY